MRALISPLQAQLTSRLPGSPASTDPVSPVTNQHGGERHRHHQGEELHLLLLLLPGEGGVAGLPADPGRGVQHRPDVRLGEAGRHSGLVQTPQGGPGGHRECRSLQHKCDTLPSLQLNISHLRLSSCSRGDLEC